MHDWIVGNLKRRGTRIKGLDWSLIFGVTCWSLWKCRNEWIFNNKDQEVFQLVQRIRLYTTKINLVVENLSILDGVVGPQGFAWSLPHPQYYKLNTDGAFNHASNRTFADGIIRNDTGQ